MVAIVMSEKNESKFRKVLEIQLLPHTNAT